MSRETGAWMPMYWSDYFGDTLHLTAEEHGAYLMLIGVYWLRGAALPDDERFLRRCAKLSRHKWKKTGESLRPFFIINNGLWTHERLEKEILRSSTRLRSARAAGKAGGLAKGYLTTTTTTVKQETTADAVVKKPAKGPDNEKRGTRLSPDWQPDEQDCQFARSHGHDPNILGPKFRDYWIGVSGKAGCKLDWKATWRNKCRYDAEHAAERVQNRPSSGGVVAGTLADLAALDGEL